MLSLSRCSWRCHKTSRHIFLIAVSLFAFVIIHQGHGQKEIKWCLPTFIPLDNWDHFPRENFTTDLTQRRFRGAIDFALKQVGEYFLMLLFARCLHLRSSLRRAIDMFSILLPQWTHWRTNSMTQRSNYPPQTAQILNYWPPWARNSPENTTSPLISQ